MEKLALTFLSLRLSSTSLDMLLATMYLIENGKYNVEVVSGLLAKALMAGPQ